MGNQIDYISISKKFRKGIQQVKTMPSADLGAGSDRVAVVREIEVEVKKVKKNKKIRRYCNIMRRNEEIRSKYTVEVSNKYEALSEKIEGEGAERD